MVEAAAESDRLAEGIASLPEREKLVIALYYYENLTLRDIAHVLGVSEARTSQLHTKAVLRLKSRLQSQQPSQRLDTSGPTRRSPGRLRGQIMLADDFNRYAA